MRNIEFSKDFVENVFEEDLGDSMHQSSAEYPSDVDEFKEVGLTLVRSDLVKAPRVGESSVNMGCKLFQILEYGEAPTGGHLVVGEVILVQVWEELWSLGHIKRSQFKPIGRLGKELYCRVTDIFEMKGDAKSFICEEEQTTSKS